MLKKITLYFIISFIMGRKAAKHLNKKRLIIIAVVVLVAGALAAVCFKPVRSFINGKKEYTAEGFYMNTYVTAKVTGESSDATAKIILTNIETIENLCLSRTVEGSDIFNLNEKGSFQVSDLTLSVLKTALDVCDKSGGALDIGIADLVDLWNINQGAAQPPEEEKISSLKGNKYSNISINGSSVTLDNGAKIDLGSVGKGAACDTVLTLLEMSGAKRAVVSIGGSILLYGDGDFTVGIASPEKGSADYIATINTQSGFVSTSGTYERFFDYNGVRYHHILDPETGYPVQNGLASVTIVSDSGVLSDALSTACFVLGIENGKKLAEQYGCQAIFVTDDKQIYSTDGIRNQIEITDNSYTMAD